MSSDLNRHRGRDLLNSVQLKARDTWVESKRIKRTVQSKTWNKRY